MDIALVLDRIRPDARWRRAATYEELEATWEDEVQTLPTLREISDEWAVIQAEQPEKDDTRQLAAELPTIAEQLAALHRARQGDPTALSTDGPARLQLRENRWPEHGI